MNPLFRSNNLNMDEYSQFTMREPYTVRSIEVLPCRSTKFAPYRKVAGVAHASRMANLTLHREVAIPKHITPSDLAVEPPAL